ncbi:hypothetical protein K491DRAFT_689131 [Lophiostoma macrostomum CBS 122681]|uniref:F-box domain-containing protein n=1 Tax=Lophiostoma macrostomum CBS 122681 TaxID=1314788 RepID=A0A6A6TJQ0_9PLEO|nr:hypothetical protein K491DRAFT_689131 [Lophiostoma macrostomum CBS 122681]
MQHFAFLQLPPELRNRIYSFALQSPTGTLRLECSSHRHGRDREIEKTGYTSKATKPMKSVYLHENDCDSPLRLLRRRPEFNQLKYVCRSLYHETAGIELHFNEILLAQRRYRDRDPVEQYHTLLSHLSPSRLTWLRTITLVQHLSLFHQGYFGSLCNFLTPKRFEDFQDLCALCKRLPNVNIRVVLPGFTYHANGQGRASAAKFIFYCALALLVLRDERSISWEGIVYRKIEERSRIILQNKDVGTWQVRNLRFLTELSAFEYEEFWGLVQKDWKWFKAEGFEDMEGWARRAREWVVDGI